MSQQKIRKEKHENNNNNEKIKNVCSSGDNTGNITSRQPGRLYEFLMLQNAL